METQEIGSSIACLPSSCAPDYINLCKIHAKYTRTCTGIRPKGSTTRSLTSAEAPAGDRYGQTSSCRREFFQIPRPEANVHSFVQTYNNYNVRPIQDRPTEGKKFLHVPPTRIQVATISSRTEPASVLRVSDYVSGFQGLICESQVG